MRSDSHQPRPKRRPRAHQGGSPVGRSIRTSIPSPSASTAARPATGWLTVTIELAGCTLARAAATSGQGEASRVRASAQTRAAMPPLDRTGQMASTVASAKGSPMRAISAASSGPVRLPGRAPIQDPARRSREASTVSTQSVRSAAKAIDDAHTLRNIETLSAVSEAAMRPFRAFGVTAVAR